MWQADFRVETKNLTAFELGGCGWEIHLEGGVLADFLGKVAEVIFILAGKDVRGFFEEFAAFQFGRCWGHYGEKGHVLALLCGEMA